MQIDHDGCNAVTRSELSQALHRLDVGISTVELDRYRYYTRILQLSTVVKRIALIVRLNSQYKCRGCDLWVTNQHGLAFY